MAKRQIFDDEIQSQDWALVNVTCAKRAYPLRVLLQKKAPQVLPTPRGRAGSTSSTNEVFTVPTTQVYPDHGEGGEAAPLPCLSSNNCITVSPENASKRLSCQHKKSAAALSWNVKAMAEKYGLERVGFLTLTFADHVLQVSEAQRRFKSLANNILRIRYQAWMAILERQKSGRLHFHLLVVLPQDIRTGFDFLAISQHDYRSAGSFLRSEWAFWRKTAKAYGFGRTELFPIRSTEEGIGRYVGKYIGKHMEARQDEDKGARLVRYSSKARYAVTRFSWASPGAADWRRKVKSFAWMLFESQGITPTMAGLREALGPRWAYRWREFILALP